MEEIERILRCELAELRERHRVLAKEFFQYTIGFPYHGSGVTHEEWDFAAGCVIQEFVTRYLAGAEPGALVLETEPWPSGELEGKMMRYISELRRGGK
jgi:hypothetical protein